MFNICTDAFIPSKYVAAIVLSMDTEINIKKIYFS